MLSLCATVSPIMRRRQLPLNLQVVSLRTEEGGASKQVQILLKAFERFFLSCLHMSVTGKKAEYIIL